VFVLKLGFFNIRFGGKLSPTPYTFLSSQSHLPHHSKTSFEQTTKVTFNRRLANITGLVARGFHYPYTQNRIKTSCMKML